MLNSHVNSFNVSCKQVILGSQEGPLQLWNISTKTKLYEFKGWNSSVCSCVSSPALDVVAVGCADGKIHVHNIRYDEELVTFSHSMRGSVTALSFSTGIIHIVSPSPSSIKIFPAINLVIFLIQGCFYTGHVLFRLQ